MDSTVAVTKSWASHAFDWTIVALGSLIALAASALAGHQQRARRGLLAFLGVPLIVVMGFFPMLVGRTGGGIEVGLDVCVLVFLLCVTEPVVTLVVWALGTGVCQLLTDKQRATKAFNFGLGVLAGGLAIFVFELTRPSSTDTRLRSCSPSDSAPWSTSSSTSSSRRSRWPRGGHPAPRGVRAARGGDGRRGLPRHLVARLPRRDRLPAAAAVGDRPARRARRPRSWSPRACSRAAPSTRAGSSVLLDTAVKVQSLVDRETLLDTLRQAASDLLHDPRVDAAADAAGRARDRRPGAGHRGRAVDRRAGPQPGPLDGPRRPQRPRRAGRAGRRRLHPAESERGDGAPGLARPADQPRQPGPVHGPGRARDGDAAPPVGTSGGAVLRPGRLQAGQRPVRARRRRRGAGRGRPADPGRGSAGGHRRPTRRRRVRRAARGRPRRGRRAGVQPDPSVAARRHPALRRGRRGDDVDRRRACRRPARRPTRCSARPTWRCTTPRARARTGTRPTGCRSATSAGTASS